MGELRVGACSWKYPSWKGLVYSRAQGIDYLAEYAARYRSVEIDQWFWTLPERATAEEYARATPEDFLFTVKLPNALSLTHFYKKRGETELRPNPQFLSTTLYAEILSRLAPLHPKIGMLMLQFEYLNKQKMASQEEFLARLAAFADAALPKGAQRDGPRTAPPPANLPLAMEPRNPKWLDDRYFALLAEKGLAHVFLQGYYMPPVFEVYRACRDALRGAVVVRLHGPDREGMEKATGERWDRIVAPRDAELDAVAGMIADMRGRGLTVYLNINNHYEGSAPLTIERLLERGVS
jgi:uncharacterized protein YecE (DUF72 family)